LVLLLIVAMPFLGRWRLGHRFNVGVLGVLLAGAGLLTVQAITADRADSDYQLSRRVAARDAERAVQLASAGIPITGALSVMRDDPYTQGPRIFSRNCASCHRFDGHDGMGYPLPADSISASDLKDFGSRRWLSGFLHADTILSKKYWGGTYHAEGDMVGWLGDHQPETAEEKQTRQNVVFALSAQAQLPGQRAIDQRDSARIAAGREFLRNTDYGCASCHRFEDVGTDSPELTGWGSREWMIAFINDPEHPRFFGRDNDRMPSFGKEKSLSDREIAMVVDWLRNDWRIPAKPASAPKP
jgi:ubiquinol-cytochrome c reductase cytochrome b subunit